MYSPKIAEGHVPKLYKLAKRYKVHMTTLVNLIIAVGIEELEHHGAEDHTAITGTVAKGQKRRILKERITTDAQSRRTRPKKHERGRFYHAHALRQRDKR